MQYIVTTPWWLRLWFPGGLTWRMSAAEKVIYLTFDDGPHPHITPFVLEQLRQYNAKATFFCIGKNVAAYPDVYRNILLDGHTTGNHTFNHLRSAKTPDQEWIADVQAAADWIDSDLFRPPYGSIKRWPAHVLRKAVRPYRIVMWDVLSADFDTRKSGSTCFNYVKKYGREGSIVVFHDSEKAWPRLEYCLPETLRHFAAMGFRFEAIR